MNPIFPCLHQARTSGHESGTRHMVTANPVDNGYLIILLSIFAGSRFSISVA